MPSNRKKRKKNKSKQRRSSSAKRAKKTVRAKRARPKSSKKAKKKKQPKKKSSSRKSAPRKRARTTRAQSGASSWDRESAASGRQSGDLQGLSRTEEADSESVDELVEEGNPFEADAVSGVEEADNADEKEVHTHEVPEDDVPEEYLDKD